MGSTFLWFLGTYCSVTPPEMSIIKTRPERPPMGVVSPCPKQLFTSTRKLDEMGPRIVVQSVPSPPPPPPIPDGGIGATKTPPPYKKSESSLVSNTQSLPNPSHLRVPGKSSPVHASLDVIALKHTLREQR